MTKHHLGDYYRVKGQNDLAARWFEEALATRQTLLGNHHPQTVLTMLLLASCANPQRSDALVGELLAVEESLDPAQLAGLLSTVGWTRRGGDLATAETRLRRAAGLQRSIGGPNSLSVAGALAMLATVLLEMDRPAEAEPLAGIIRHPL